MTDITKGQKRRLQSHFGLSKIPFSKYMWAAQMFDSAAQRDLLHGLVMWTEVRGIALVTGPSGVGKSITLRRFVKELDENRFHTVDFTTLPCTVNGFLRSLCRSLGLPMRLHASDLFDAAHGYLVSVEKDKGLHPVLVLDDAEGLSAPVIDTIRRLTAVDLDAEDRFSIVLSGSDDLLETLAHPSLVPLKTRVSYIHDLRPFGLEDTVNYVRFHLERADANAKLFSQEATKKLFHASQGRPRAINQLAVQALIQAAVQGHDTVDGDFMSRLIAGHPFYRTKGGDR